MDNFSKKSVAIAIVTFFLAIAIAFGFSIILAVPVWLLWNWLIPLIFGVTKLTLIQAWGLTFLCGLLFKSSAPSSKSSESSSK